MNLHVVVGLEMHCEMKSTSKVFSPASNSYSVRANTNVSEIDLGHPGILPTVNLECVRKALKAALILNCNIPEVMLFDRKNYYYPDLPKGYQITQNTKPVGTHGYIDIEVGDAIKRVSIQDIHLEEDTAQLDHLEKMSLINYNRACVPLLECVTDPCIHSSEEALAFIDTMCKIYQYTGISDADTKKGQIRCDVNVNLQDENGNYVTPKVEMKNINSLANVKLAIEYEEKRQREALENGEPLYQETRRFDEETGTTKFMRSKADAIDYKYFVEPNIPPYRISDKLISDIKATIPRLALERKNDYINNLNIDKESASIIVKNIDMANYFEKCVSLGMNAKTAANYLLGLITSYLYREEIDIKEFFLTPELLIDIVKKQEDGSISSKQAKEIFFKCLEEHKKPNEVIDSNVSQLSDSEKIESIIDNILTNSSQQVDDYHNGRTNLFDYFVGQVMKETKGQANPVITKEILSQKLNRE